MGEKPGEEDEAEQRQFQTLSNASRRAADDDPTDDNTDDDDTPNAARQGGTMNSIRNLKA